ncbi:MAG: hypothetical protein H6892_02570 [Brucellaceae bacterium]|nr:hypothetical protein [Brucellaceae bacterium]
MLQILLNALRPGKLRNDASPVQVWRCDPLAHPILDRMTPAELGDLPLGSVRYNCRGD